LLLVGCASGDDKYDETRDWSAEKLYTEAKRADAAWCASRPIAGITSSPPALTASSATPATQHPFSP
jgi:hypothetical protein